MSRKQLPNRRTRRAKTRWFARHKHLLRNGVLVVLLAAIPVQSVLLWREVLPQHTLSLPHCCCRRNRHRPMTPREPCRFDLLRAARTAYSAWNTTWTA